MSCIPQIRVSPWLERLDPRGRLIGALILALAVALAHRSESLALAAILCSGLVIVSRVERQPLFRRIGLVIAFSLFILIMLPLFYPGEPLFNVWIFNYSVGGLVVAARIVARLVLIVVMVTVLLASLSSAQLSQALATMGVAPSLVFLFSFTLRYAGIMRAEYRRVMRAMQMRGFQGGIGIFALRSYANAVGMVLIRSFDRAEKVQQAMELRGFDGQLRVAHYLRFGAGDYLFVLVSLVLSAGLIVVELV